jgi:hypothetical protein
MGPVSVTVAQEHGTLVVDVEAAAEPSSLVDLDDRVSVLGGNIAIERTASGIRIRTVIPCA